MYSQILEMMEPYKDKVSFYSRMKMMDKFFAEEGIYDLVYEPHVEEPLSIVWAISISHGEIFDTQLRSILQLPEILQDHDQIVFVVDKDRGEDVDRVLANLGDFIDIEVVHIDRHCMGDRPTLNWDLGLPYVKNQRVLFVRDLCLLFNPWEFIGNARKVDIQGKLTNSSVILGPTISRYTDQWVYLVHPLYSPTPYLFAFVAGLDDVKSINGFDRTFSRGFDHAGELDFVLRWVMNGYEYDITDKIEVLHPGIPASREALEEMQIQSSVNRRYFFDRYGEELLDHLKPPFRLDVPLIEVAHAKTLHPLTIKTGLEDQKGIISKVSYPRKIGEFMKRPDSYYVIKGGKCDPDIKR